MPVDDAARARSGSSRPFPVLLAGAALVLLVLRVGATWWESRSPHAGGDLVHWVPFEDAEVLAVSQGKPVLYDFTADWCPPCQAMKREVFADPQRAQVIERLFVPVRVLDRAREEGRNAPVVDSLQRAFGVQAFPTLVVRVPGATRFEKTDGYLGTMGTLQWMTRAAAMARLGDTPGH